MNLRMGKLIVIDGIDGSGKTTQIELLKQALASQGVPLEAISFPGYEDNIYGKLIKKYLEGEFGSIDEVNPYFLALAYAGDRALAKTQIEKWLAEGKLVIANRYVSASKAHLGANLPEEKREEFIKWLDELEYQTNGMPKEDLTILLKIDPKVGQKNVEGIHGSDIHEENLQHLEQANKIYLDLAKKQKNWYVVDCMKDGDMREKGEIHSEIIGKISI
ncbi:MAG: dTMP kinase [Candidatus Daviesbacteria bacterium]|nr:dTMP kinase [Candidatus Daviesbacteria bacterium]